MHVNKPSLVIALTAGSLLVSGCASTYQKRTATPSGFLKNYEQLSDRGGDTALLSYIAPDADFTRYKKIMIDPVRIYAADPDSGIAKLSTENQKALLNYFDATLRKNLEQDFVMVAQPGPDVLRLRVAITEAKGAKVLLDTVSSVVPVGLAASSIKAIATGKHLSVGEIGTECEALDSVTGKRLFAAVDARVGRKYTLKFDKFKKWRTAEDAFDFWAGRLHDGLKEHSTR